MSKGKLHLKINENSLKTVIGIAICCIAVILALNHGYIGSFLFWLSSIIIGSVFTYVLSLIIFVIGLSFIVKKRIVKHNLKFCIIGLVLISIGVLICTTNSISYDNSNNYLTFSNFMPTLIESMNLKEFPHVIIDRSGGFIGYLLVAIINSAMTDLGLKIFSSILIGIGTFFVLLRPFILLINSIKKDVKAKQNTAPKIDDFKEEQRLIDNLDTGGSLFKDGNIDDTSAIKEEENKVITEEINDNDLAENVAPSFEDVKPIISNNVTNFNKYEENTGLEKVHFKFGSEEKETPTQNIVFDSGNNNTYDNSNNYNNPINNNIYENKVEETPATNNYEENNKTLDNEIVEEQPIINETNFNNVNNVASSTSIEKEASTINNSTSNDKPKVIISKKSDSKPVVYPKFSVISSDYLEDRTSVEEEERNKICAENRLNQINNILQDLKIKASIVSYTIGPSVTRYDLKTDASFSINGISKYMDDISVRLGGMDARFVPIVQGRTTSGIEIANEDRSLVNFKDVYNHLPTPKPGHLYIPFGKNISGAYINADLVDFPHMLVCGTTGSGKSIFMHSVILSLIMRNSPEDLRLVMVDPKRVEFSKYKEMPHLLCPIITEPTEASATLSKLVDEMEDRYTKFELTSVSNIKQYNEYASETKTEKIPYIIVIIDEFADLIESVKSIEKPVQRLGQKARAAGIHMIIATQRPSTDVITGSIKANLGTRVALLTSSTTDSMVILGEGGAEKLLGNGDMLVSCNLISKQEKPRVQGCFVDNMEIKRVVDYLKLHFPLNYDQKFVGLLDKARLEQNDLGVIHEVPKDEMYETVKEYIMANKESCSISMIQREFNFGYNRSSHIFQRLKDDGIVESGASTNSNKGAKVLVHTSDYKDPTEAEENPGSYSQSSFVAK